MSNAIAPRRVFALSSLVLAGALAGSGGNVGLTAQGFFTASTPTFETGINLVEETAIDRGGLVTGSCEIRETPAGRSVSIDLYTADSGADNQLRRASITGVLGSSTVGLTAQVGNTTFSRGDCAASVDAIDLNGSAVLSTSGACTLDASGGNTIDANVDLAVFGCRVITE